MNKDRKPERRYTFVLPNGQVLWGSAEALWSAAKRETQLHWIKNLARANLARVRQRNNTREDDADINRAALFAVKKCAELQASPPGELFELLEHQLRITRRPRSKLEADKWFPVALLFARLSPTTTTSVNANPENTSLRAAARAAGVSHHTVKRWLDDPDFKILVQLIRMDLQQRRAELTARTPRKSQSVKGRRLRGSLRQ